MIGATTRHHDVATSADVASARPGARAGRRDGRRPDGAEPRHARRLARARGTAWRPAGGDARARRRDRRRRGGPASARSRPTTSSPTTTRRRSRDGRARHLGPHPRRASRAAPTSSSTAGRSTGRSSASRCRRGGEGWRIGLDGRRPDGGAGPRRRGGAGAAGHRIAEASLRASEGLDPPEGLDGSAEYKRHLATVLVRRALEAAG